jgi:hypothetical protein
MESLRHVLGENLFQPRFAGVSATQPDDFWRCPQSLEHFREILVQVLTNPHLNLKTRTNVPLMRSKTFRDIVGIKKGDKMYNDEFDVVF